MSDSRWSISPAVGIGDGTLLVGWPCRLVSGRSDNEGGFVLMPVAVWTDGAVLRIVVMQPDGRTISGASGDFQFDPKWHK